MQHILGYGSLINPRSRAKTLKDLSVDAPSIAVRVHGYRRVWSQSSNYSTVSVMGDPESYVNGVAFTVTEEHLPLIDEREHGYERELVPLSRVRAYDGHALEFSPGASFWIYTKHTPVSPTIECPIVQSYLDVILHGAMILGPRFTAEFMISTWYTHPMEPSEAIVRQVGRIVDAKTHSDALDHPHVVHAFLVDRNNPLYVRPEPDVDVEAIEALLRYFLPAQTAARHQ